MRLNKWNFPGRQFPGLVVVVSLLVVFLLGSPTEATIAVKVAEVQNGLAVIQGTRAVPNADIFWEGARVTQANKGGSFSFSATVPADCVGTLSDGTPIEVTLLDCTPIDPVPAPVARTGQTTSYSPRDDGALQKGIAWPTPRFTDNNNGTVSDNLTGLIWWKNANCIGTLNPDFDQDGSVDGAVPWQEALNFVTGVNNGIYNCDDRSGSLGSHQTDWRLPNIRELQSLVDYGRSRPALPDVTGAPFTNFRVDLELYQSSTTLADNTDSRWVVNFALGFVTVGSKTNNHAWVIAVRSGS